jgi:hypothetical protein
MFLSLRLTRLYLTIPDSAVGLKNFFTAIKTTCPFLKVVSINGDKNSEELRTAVSSLVYGLSCLEVVWCSSFALNCEALKSFAPSSQRCTEVVPHDTWTTILLHGMAQVALDAPLSHSLDTYTISPLLQCPNLQYISFGICYGQEAINNSLMMDMAPCLRTIHFYSFHRASRWHSKVNLELPEVVVLWCQCPSDLTYHSP